MKWFLLFTLINLVSCSSNPRSELLESRAPSSDGNADTCDALLHPFIQSAENRSSKRSLLEKGIIQKSDLKILKGDLLLNSLPENPEEKEQVEIAYLLIQKKFPHFDQEQIHAHYELLKEYCGM
ncbi:MAG: hypothetical protein ACXVLQ_00875 [Bacteriovorax sp.]